MTPAEELSTGRRGRDGSAAATYGILWPPELGWENKMMRFAKSVVCGMYLLTLQMPTPARGGETTDQAVMHYPRPHPGDGGNSSMRDPWYFVGSSRADAVAGYDGENGSGIVVECNGTVPRVLVFFSSDLAAFRTEDRVTQQFWEALAWHFTKRSLVSVATDLWNTSKTLNAYGRTFQTARSGRDPSSEFSIFEGAVAQSILTEIRNQDSVSVQHNNALVLDSSERNMADHVAHFELRNAGDAIERLAKVCSRP